jgi:hypothetical protein
LSKFKIMKIFKAVILVVILVFSDDAFCQDTLQSIATDRPDQTETPFLVPKGMFQMENGFVYEKTNSDENALVSPTILAKYGVNDNFELRLIVEYNTIETGDQKISGINPVLVGTKIKMCDEKGMIPKTSFIGHLLLPDLASPELKAEYYAAMFRFTMQHTLSSKINLGYNFGAEWDGMTPDATFVYTLTTGFSLSEKFGAYLEVFGFAPQNDIANHSADGGFTYLLSNNAMVDLSGGFGITENAPDYFISCGFSFRI